MTADTECPVEERLVQLLRHLGIGQAHVAGRLTSDWNGLVCSSQDHSALTLVCPMDLPPSAFRSLVPRLLMFTGDQRAPAESVRKATETFPQATS